MFGCCECQALKNFPRFDEAEKLLQKVCAQVQPIMTKHQWKVPLVVEFFPANPGLLGMNMNSGQKIMIRLRPSKDRGSFLEWQDILGTMLHELTHNQCGPHDDAFNKLLEILWTETEALIGRGVTGDNPTNSPGYWAPSSLVIGKTVVLGPGSRSGGTRLLGLANAATTATNKLSAREAMAAAAEKREKNSRLMGAAGGQRLGGGAGSGAPLPQTAAGKRSLFLSAAERRIMQDKECANGWINAQRPISLSSSSTSSFPSSSSSTSSKPLSSNPSLTSSTKSHAYPVSSSSSSSSSSTSSSSSSSSAAAVPVPLRIDQIVIDVIEIDDDNTEVLSQQILGIQLESVHLIEDHEHDDYDETTVKNDSKKDEEKSSKRVKREPSIIIIDD
jgi:DNA-dependent metalloprotease WSS1